ncbi:MAG: pantoate--beta-alanine ligase [Crocinitomicaceae bacterium]|nr:pantoate--beta-alanine ligase [Crocinitomicaceae bacterium]MDG1776329.1 pantoate--beta-alanine ligase [Crocinitomicaceae bacterium]
MKDLNVFTTLESLRERVKENGDNSSVALVPTMGALHHGHLELVKKGMSLADEVVVSIFVNPTQFNKKEDLDNYPRTLEHDVRLLSSLGNVIIFTPSVNEVYPENHCDVTLDLGNLEHVMEGEFRPGHFNGVVNVVKRLIEMVQPAYSLFGLKDFQQLAVINFMVKSYDLDTQVVPCDIVREPSGFASSSRNQRLSEQEKFDAVIIHKTMMHLRDLAKKCTPSEAKKKAVDFFNKGTLELEYLTIVDPETLMEIDTWVPGARTCLAAHCNKVRLIDNMELIASELGA